jgi:hypothetical protein
MNTKNSDNVLVKDVQVVHRHNRLTANSVLKDFNKQMRPHIVQNLPHCIWMGRNKKQSHWERKLYVINFTAVA